MNYNSNDLFHISDNNSKNLENSPIICTSPHVDATVTEADENSPEKSPCDLHSSSESLNILNTTTSKGDDSSDSDLDTSFAVENSSERSGNYERKISDIEEAQNETDSELNKEDDEDLDANSKSKNALQKKSTAIKNIFKNTVAKNKQSLKIKLKKQDIIDDSLKLSQPMSLRPAVSKTKKDCCFGCKDKVSSKEGPPAKTKVLSKLKIFNPQKYKDIVETPKENISVPFIKRLKLRNVPGKVETNGVNAKIKPIKVILNRKRESIRPVQSDVESEAENIDQKLKKNIMGRKANSSDNTNVLKDLSITQSDVEQDNVKVRLEKIDSPLEPYDPEKEFECSDDTNSSSEDEPTYSCEHCNIFQTTKRKRLITHFKSCNRLCPTVVCDTLPNVIHTKVCKYCKTYTNLNKKIWRAHVKSCKIKFAMMKSRKLKGKEATGEGVCEEHTCKFCNYKHTDMKIFLCHLRFCNAAVQSYTDTSDSVNESSSSTIDQSEEQLHKCSSCKYVNKNLNIFLNHLKLCNKNYNNLSLKDMLLKYKSKPSVIGYTKTNTGDSNIPTNSDNSLRIENDSVQTRVTSIFDPIPEPNEFESDLSVQLRNDDPTVIKSVADLVTQNISLENGKFGLISRLNPLELSESSGGETPVHKNQVGLIETNLATEILMDQFGSFNEIHYDDSDNAVEDNTNDDTWNEKDIGGTDLPEENGNENREVEENVADDCHENNEMEQNDFDARENVEPNSIYLSHSHDDLEINDSHPVRDPVDSGIIGIKSDHERVAFSVDNTDLKSDVEIVNSKNSSNNDKDIFLRKDEQTVMNLNNDMELSTSDKDASKAGISEKSEKHYKSTQDNDNVGKKGCTSSVTNIDSSNSLNADEACSSEKDSVVVASNVSAVNSESPILRRNSIANEYVESGCKTLQSSLEKEENGNQINFEKRRLSVEQFEAIASNYFASHENHGDVEENSEELQDLIRIEPTTNDSTGIIELQKQSFKDNINIAKKTSKNTDLVRRQSSELNEIDLKTLSNTESSDISREMTGFKSKEQIISNVEKPTSDLDSECEDPICKLDTRQSSKTVKIRLKTFDETKELVMSKEQICSVDDSPEKFESNEENMHEDSLMLYSESADDASEGEEPVSNLDVSSIHDSITLSSSISIRSITDETNEDSESVFSSGKEVEDKSDLNEDEVDTQNKYIDSDLGLQKVVESNDDDEDAPDSQRVCLNCQLFQSDNVNELIAHIQECSNVNLDDSSEEEETEESDLDENNSIRDIIGVPTEIVMENNKNIVDECSEMANDENIEKCLQNTEISMETSISRKRKINLEREAADITDDGLTKSSEETSLRSFKSSQLDEDQIEISSNIKRRRNSSKEINKDIVFKVPNLVDNQNEVSSNFKYKEKSQSLEEVDLESNSRNENILKIKISVGKNGKNKKESLSVVKEIGSGKVIENSSESLIADGIEENNSLTQVVESIEYMEASITENRETIENLEDNHSQDDIIGPIEAIEETDSLTTVTSVQKEKESTTPIIEKDSTLFCSHCNSFSTDSVNNLLIHFKQCTAVLDEHGATPYIVSEFSDLDKTYLSTDKKFKQLVNEKYTNILIGNQSYKAMSTPKNFNDQSLLKSPSNQSKSSQSCSTSDSQNRPKYMTDLIPSQPVDDEEES